MSRSNREVSPTISSDKPSDKKRRHPARLSSKSNLELLGMSFKLTGILALGYLGLSTFNKITAFYYALPESKRTFFIVAASVTLFCAAVPAGVVIKILINNAREKRQTHLAKLAFEHEQAERARAKRIKGSF